MEFPAGVLKIYCEYAGNRIFQAKFQINVGKNELEQAITHLSNSYIVTTMPEIEVKQLAASHMLASREAKVNSK